MTKVAAAKLGNVDVLADVRDGALVGHLPAQLGFSLSRGETVALAGRALGAEAPIDAAITGVPRAVIGLAAVLVGPDVDAAGAVGTAAGRFVGAHGGNLLWAGPGALTRRRAA